MWQSRGISLLSVAGKVLAGVMLRRLLTHVVDIVMPESQCGFRRGRSTIDMMFVARLLQEINVKKLVSLKHGVRAIKQTYKTAQITFARILDRTHWLPLQI